MMVDDNDVALGRSASHLGDKAPVELLAIGADTAVGTRIELRPEMAVLGQVRQLAAIANFGGLFPVADDAKLLDFLQAVEERLLVRS